MPADLRQRIGMMFISIDPTAGAARSAAATGMTRTDCRRLVQGRQMSGGKGAKGGNLDSLGNMGPAGDVVQRRKLAETLLGGRIAVGKYSRAQESGRRAELLAIGGSLAEIAETPSTSPPGFGVAPPKPLKPSSR
jgi:hypothetical protein